MPILIMMTAMQSTQPLWVRKPRRFTMLCDHKLSASDDYSFIWFLGPWGDAIMHELLPAIESRFRGIGEGWARFTYGGSTGGWEALAVQVGEKRPN